LNVRDFNNVPEKNIDALEISFPPVVFSGIDAEGPRKFRTTGFTVFSNAIVGINCPVSPENNGKRNTKKGVGRGRDEWDSLRMR